jgi:hypothetical protein
MLADYVEQSPSWKVSGSSVGHEIPRLLYNPKVHYRVYTARLDLALNRFRFEPNIFRNTSLFHVWGNRLRLWWLFLGIYWNFIFVKGLGIWK